MVVEKPDFSVLNSHCSCTIFLITLLYTIYNDMDFTRLVYSVIVDLVLEMFSICLNFEPSDGRFRRFHIFVPWLFRALGVVFLYVYWYAGKNTIFVYLTLTYLPSTFYSNFPCTNYHKTRMILLISDALLFVTAFLGMCRFYLGKDISYSTIVAPLFYTSIFNSTLMVCLLVWNLYKFCKTPGNRSRLISLFRSLFSSGHCQPIIQYNPIYSCAPLLLFVRYCSRWLDTEPDHFAAEQLSTGVGCLLRLLHRENFSILPDPTTYQQQVA